MVRAVSNVHHGKVGVIADTSLQRHLIQALIQAQGYQVTFNLAPDRVDIDTLKSAVAAWYVDLVSDESDWSDFIDLILEYSDVPVLFGDGEEAPPRTSENYPRWERRLLNKLSNVVPLPPAQLPQTEEATTPIAFDTPKEAVPLPSILASLAAEPPEVPERVWVLGASLGGPSAVKHFLDCLPGKLPIAFVYAQHIDSSFEEVLGKSVGRHSEFQVVLAKDGHRLAHGEVLVVPIDNVITFGEQAEVIREPREWDGPYNPCIDQVMNNTLQRFGKHTGAIIFSGMGQDGVKAAANFKEVAAPIWTQAPESCASSSMPDAIIDAGLNQFSADPVGLAEQLVQHIADEVKNNPPQRIKTS
ncbi:chemotaxis protein CheB [Spartinivicinus poritis]|uniref:protein-glutamate methylesterase n=1 Tax=Spartinivicinus poritis TaxID=2994640 RepID=A0ABT5UAW4_9GAMM|nr:chemotaxis protein CheB [Spartinivicinus sp. A2-2]MDE1463320.1 chemotaxis protein CheB [Spartinivicinus sp. A2-2]